MDTESRLSVALKNAREFLGLLRDLLIFGVIVVIVLTPEKTVPTFEAVGKALAKAGFTRVSFAGV